MATDRNMQLVKSNVPLLSDFQRHLFKPLCWSEGLFFFQTASHSLSYSDYNYPDLNAFGCFLFFLSFFLKSKVFCWVFLTKK